MSQHIIGRVSAPTALIKIVTTKMPRGIVTNSGIRPLDAIEEFDDANLLLEIEELQTELTSIEEELALVQASIAPVFSNIPENLIIQYGENVDLLGLGLTALDNLDGDLTASISVDTLDTTLLTIGNHGVLYSVVDSDENTTTYTLTITVEFTSLDFNYEFINDGTEVKTTEYYLYAPKDVVVPETIY